MKRVELKNGNVAMIGQYVTIVGSKELVDNQPKIHKCNGAIWNTYDKEKNAYVCGYCKIITKQC